MTAKAGRADVYRAGKQRPSYFERWEVPQFPGGVARFTTNVQTSLATIQVVADCESSCKK